VQRYVIVVEHDLSVLDYLSDFICCLYGKPGAYGVVTLPFSVREGINIFLAGEGGGLQVGCTALSERGVYCSGTATSLSRRKDCCGSVTACLSEVNINLHVHLQACGWAFIVDSLVCLLLSCAGFVPTENLRFREESLTFKVAEQDTKEEEVKKFLRYQYPAMKKTQVRGAGG
jgi:hypothetical protein